MTDEEIKEHFNKANLEVTKAIQEQKSNFERITDIIHDIYSQVNKGEIIVATGAFALVIAFLTQNKSESPYNYPLFLKVATGFLLFVIVWKFHLNRSSARRAEYERDLTSQSLELLKKIQEANVQFLVLNDPGKLKSVEQYFNKLEFIEKERERLNSGGAQKRGFYSNEIEYVAFFCGTGLLLIFFILNI